MSTSVETIKAEITAADTALDYFDIVRPQLRRSSDSQLMRDAEQLFYDGGEICGSNPDPNLANCLNAALAFMLNSTDAWTNVKRLHFFLSYSNDIDRNNGHALVGSAGDAKWRGLVATWVAAMKHPRYLKVDGRPVFKVLIPDIFLTECGGNASLADERISQLREEAIAAGVGNPLVGGGWQNPSIPSTAQSYPRPHPVGYMLYPQTTVPCKTSPECNIAEYPQTSILECESKCNATALCTAFTITSGQSGGVCTLKSVDGPGAPSPAVDTYVRVRPTLVWEWTGTYNDAPPVCPKNPNWICPEYVNSWQPNATPTGAKIFPYMECGGYQVLPHAI